MTSQIFQTPIKTLQEESMRLLLRQKTDQEVYMEKQRKLLREIRE
jgi:hypothetical protein